LSFEDINKQLIYDHVAQGGSAIPDAQTLKEKFAKVFIVGNPTGGHWVFNNFSGLPKQEQFKVLFPQKVDNKLYMHPAQKKAYDQIAKGKHYKMDEEMEKENLLESLFAIMKSQMKTL